MPKRTKPLSLILLIAQVRVDRWLGRSGKKTCLLYLDLDNVMRVEHYVAYLENISLQWGK